MNANTGTNDATKTLIEANIPSHSHTMSHTHGQQGTFATISQDNSTTTTESANHTHSWGCMYSFIDGIAGLFNGGGGSDYIGNSSSIGPGTSSSSNPNASAYSLLVGASGEYGNTVRQLYFGGNTEIDSTDHSHTLVHAHNVTISGNTTNSSATSTGTYGYATPTAINITPPYQAVYTWYRSA